MTVGLCKPTKFIEELAEQATSRAEHERNPAKVAQKSWNAVPGSRT